MQKKLPLRKAITGQMKDPCRYSKNIIIRKLKQPKEYKKKFIREALKKWGQEHGRSESFMVTSVGRKVIGEINKEFDEHYSK